MYLCICRAISEKCVQKAIESGCSSYEAIVQETGLSQGCGNCVCYAKEQCSLLLVEILEGKKAVNQSNAA